MLRKDVCLYKLVHILSTGKICTESQWSESQKHETLSHTNIEYFLLCFFPPPFWDTMCISLICTAFVLFFYLTRVIVKTFIGSDKFAVLVCNFTFTQCLIFYLKIWFQFLEYWVIFKFSRSFQLTFTSSFFFPPHSSFLLRICSAYWSGLTARGL